MRVLTKEKFLLPDTSYTTETVWVVSIIKTLAKGTLVISSLLGAHIGTDKPQINKYCIWSLLPAVFWSLPSVTSRPSAFGLSFGSCFHCPHLLIPSLGFYFLISLFLLRAEKPSCSVMKCHRGNVLNLLHPSFLRNCKHEQIPRASENSPI